MKVLKLIVIALIFSFPAFCTNPILSSSVDAEVEDATETIAAEVETLFGLVFDEIEQISLKSISEKMQVVILNEEFRKVRVDEVDKFEDIYSQSMLLPLIYRSEFISTIYNVSYFMLRK
jgi:hypothetical protein